MASGVLIFNAPCPKYCVLVLARGLWLELSVPSQKELGHQYQEYLNNLYPQIRDIYPTVMKLEG